jgi:hypothetical protein
MTTLNFICKAQKLMSKEYKAGSGERDGKLPKEIS